MALRPCGAVKATGYGFEAWGLRLEAWDLTLGAGG
jgi:hypothetical protein